MRYVTVTGGDFYLSDSSFQRGLYQTGLGTFQDDDEVTSFVANPAGPSALGLALTLEALGMTAEAESRYKEAIEEGEKRALIDYGLFLYKNGRGQESIEILRKADAPEELERVIRAVSASKALKRMPLTPEPVRFDASPLGMMVKNGAAGNKHLIETMIAGVAVLDFDNDGRLERIVVPDDERRLPLRQPGQVAVIGGHHRDLPRRAILLGDEPVAFTFTAGEIQLRTAYDH
jgi:hypothetical protein